MKSQDLIEIVEMINDLNMKLAEINTRISELLEKELQCIDHPQSASPSSSSPSPSCTGGFVISPLTLVPPDEMGKIVE